jgi:hypothetical protein
MHNRFLQNSTRNILLTTLNSVSKFSNLNSIVKDEPIKHKKQGMVQVLLWINKVIKDLITVKISIFLSTACKNALINLMFV